MTHNINMNKKSSRPSAKNIITDNQPSNAYRDLAPDETKDLSENSMKLWVEAAILEKAKEQVTNAHLKYTRKRKYIVRWIAAALITGAFMAPLSFLLRDHFRSDSGQNIVMQKDVNEDMILTPDFKSAEEKAAFGQYLPIKVLSPINSDTILLKDGIQFRWTPALEADTFLTIVFAGNSHTAFREKVSLGDTLLNIEAGILLEGKYFWTIEGFAARDSFLISAK